MNKRWEDATRAARRVTRAWWINRAFVMGQQWVRWDAPTQRVLPIAPLPRGRRRAVANLLKPAVRTQLGKMLRRPLAFEVRPNAADDVAVRGAKLGEKLLDQMARDHQWEQVRRDVLTSELIGGTSAACITWDTTIGPVLGQTDTGRNVARGDVCIKPLSLAQIGIQPGAGRADQAFWWVHQEADAPDNVRARFRLDWQPTPDAGQAPWRLLAPGDEIGDDGFMAAADGGRCLVKTLYERPGMAGGNGRIVSVVNDRIVEQSAWPFPWTDRLNLVVFREMPIDGVWWGESMMSAAVPLQADYNDWRTQFMEWRRKAGIARYFVPDPAFDETEWDDEQGTMIPYAPIAGHGEWSVPPDLPASMVEQGPMITGELEDVLSVHAVSKGENPAGDSGVALSIVAERDDTPLGVTAADQADGWGALGRMSLELWAHMRPDDGRSVVTGMTAGRPTVETVSGNDLAGQWDVYVPLDSVLPRSRAAQQAWAVQLLETGFFGTPPDMRRFAIAADLPGRDALLEGLAPDVEKAARENEAMTRGEPKVPAPFDDHGVHIAEHHEYMKSSAWDQLSPQAQEVFILHVQAHEVMAAEEAGRKAALAQGGLSGIPLATGQTSVPDGGSVLPFGARRQLAAVAAAPVGAVDPTLSQTPANTFGAAGSGTP